MLLADDHAIVREGVRLILSAQSDMEVVGEASNGEQALQLARTLQPDMVLMDIGMPELDGYEAAARIRRDHGNTNVLLVAVTCFDQEQDKQRAYDSGFDLHVPKPVSFTTLLGLLALLQKRSTRFG